MNVGEWLEHENEGLKALKAEAWRLCGSTTSVAQAHSDLLAKLHPLTVSRGRSLDALAVKLGTNHLVNASVVQAGVVIAQAGVDIAWETKSPLGVIHALKALAAVHALLLEIAEARGIEVELPA